MQNYLRNLEEAILSRKPLGQHSVNYVQREGIVTHYVLNPERPASAGWNYGCWSGGSLLIARKIPLTLNGKRIAVIDEEKHTIDALVVGEYAREGNCELAIASPNSYAVKWDLGSGQIVISQPNGHYSVGLDGRKVVGITRGEMTALRELSAQGYEEIYEQAQPSTDPVKVKHLW